MYKRKNKQTHKKKEKIIKYFRTLDKTNRGKIVTGCVFFEIEIENEIENEIETKSDSKTKKLRSDS